MLNSLDHRLSVDRPTPQSKQLQDLYNSLSHRHHKTKQQLFQHRHATEPDGKHPVQRDFIGFNYVRPYSLALITAPVESTATTVLVLFLF
ncbi:unnamed protein product [Vicia faba]|uniref:Uncharacterized protein n=1 Tax=Vicia faba TaxID=3906 RepID=A0AAV1AXU4_VICFA|nr:unnamed protein product [Vicia faba]